MQEKSNKSDWMGPKGTLCTWIQGMKKKAASPCTSLLKKKKEEEKECRVLLHFCSLIRHKCKRSFTWSQMLSFTNVLLHASCTAAYVGEEAEQQLYTELQGSVVILFFPPLFKAIFRTQAHLSNTATLLQKTKYFKGGSCLRMLFFFFFQSAATGEGKKDVNHSIVSEVYSIFITCELVVIAQKPFSLRRTWRICYFLPVSSSKMGK